MFPSREHTTTTHNTDLISYVPNMPRRAYFHKFAFRCILPLVFGLKDFSHLFGSTTYQ